MEHTPVFTDSLARKALPAPHADRPLSFYACGITPYSPAHIGHARSFVVFDLMRQVLEQSGRRVEMVRNITDIDDKILAAAKAQGVHWKALAHRNAARNRTEIAKLGVVNYEEPAASEHVEEIISLVDRLLGRGHAYVSTTGDVLFEVSSFRGSTLMPHDPNDLLSHTSGRVSDEGKRSALDFVLWKAAKPGEPSWQSPWGQGRPGWHIECSAMVEKRFGSTLDYHGGGTDLRFPHHQAEIMQSEAAFGRELAYRWVHHGSVRDAVGKKMSKSLGNYVELGDALDQAEALLPGAGGGVLRVALLSGLWTKPLDWSNETLKRAARHLSEWARAANGIPADRVAGQAVFHALANNLNTPKAYGHIHGLCKQARQGNNSAAGALSYALGLLGVPEDQVYLAARKQGQIETGNLPDAVTRLVGLRDKARAQRKWAEADALREEMSQMGYVVGDGNRGSSVTRRD